MHVLWYRNSFLFKTVIELDCINGVRKGRSAARVEGEEEEGRLKFKCCTCAFVWTHAQFSWQRPPSQRRAQSNMYTCNCYIHKNLYICIWSIWKIIWSILIIDIYVHIHMHFVHSNTYIHMHMYIDDRPDFLMPRWIIYW